MRLRRLDGRSHVCVHPSRLGIRATDTAPAPENATLVETLPSDSNILSATIEQVAVEGSLKALMFATTADRRVNILDTPSCALRSSTTGLQDSPVLSSLVLREKYVILTSMSGQLVIADLAGNVLEKRRDHAKYVVNVKVIDDTDKPLLATAAWDNKINIYSLSTTKRGFVVIGRRA